MRTTSAALAVAAALAGCGLDPFGEASGGRDNLPTVGAGPWARFDPDDATPADEPWVLADAAAELYDPAVVRRADGGLRVWMTREPVGMPADDQEIDYAELASVHAVPDAAPRLALAADQTWEEGRVLAPSVVDLGGGHLAMFYEGGVADPAIGRADSTDDGATWQKQATPVLTGATSPSVAFVLGHYELYVARPGAPGIWRATGVAGTDDLVLDAAPILEPRPGLAKAFDAADLSDPCIVVERETTGTLHWGLYVVGYATAPSDAGSGTPSVGYAASFDGIGWQRFGAAKAQLSPSETGPAVVLEPLSGVMLFADVKRGRRAIAAAHTP
jgi:hypothetical protein